MKHYVTLVQGDSASATCACYAYGSKPEAMAKFHHEMEYANSLGTTTTICSVMNENGAVVAVEKFTALPDSIGGGE